ncbi:MAG: IS5/IS1182 family transposase, partial [Moorella sp. (in: Bacteria)]|nr:IS5/IS1182 family transposase [Moorella sp. (in: firmicutes)]
AMRKAKAELEAEAKRKAEQKRRSEGADKDEDTAKPSPKAQYNFTDPDSRIMLSSDKSFIQAYNAQAAVDAQSQIIRGRRAHQPSG